LEQDGQLEGTVRHRGLWRWAVGRQNFNTRYGLAGGDGGHELLKTIGVGIIAATALAYLVQ